MKAKMCRFGTISNSVTRSTSCWRFFKNRFCCVESLTLLPFKTLILTPPAKIVNNFLPLWFRRPFFLRPRPWHHQQTEHQKTSSWNNMSIKFYVRKWTVDNVRTNTMMTPCPKNGERLFILSSDQYKKSRKARFSTAVHVWTTWEKRNFYPGIRLWSFLSGI